MEVGGVGEAVTQTKTIGKSSQNSPILVLIFWGSLPCVSIFWDLFNFAKALTSSAIYI